MSDCGCNCQPTLLLTLERLPLATSAALGSSGKTSHLSWALHSIEYAVDVFTQIHSYPKPAAPDPASFTSALRMSGLPPSRRTSSSSCPTHWNHIDPSQAACYHKLPVTNPEWERTGLDSTSRQDCTGILLSLCKWPCADHETFRLSCLPCEIQ